MANSDKNIVITPNRGQSADPNIVFSGANAAVGPQNITLTTLPASNSTISLAGSAGQLFSITNTLTGSIFSVNDVSGIPSIEVLSTGNVNLAQYGGNVGIGTGSPAVKLDVTGSVNSTNTFGFKNRLINGEMDINQRAFNGTAVEFGYTLDRWITFCGGATFSVAQNAGAVTGPPGFTNYLGVTSLAATAPAAGARNLVCQMIEGYNMADFGWGYSWAKTVTVSFWVRSSLTGTFGVAINSTTQATSYTASYTINAVNTWEFKSVIIPGPTTTPGNWDVTTGRGLWLFFDMGTGTDYQANATWDSAAKYTRPGMTNVIGTSGATWYMTGAQLEVSTGATSFDFRSIGQELALCQRYFVILMPRSVDCQQIVTRTSAVNGVMNMTTPVSMRTTPTLSAPTDGRFIAYDTSFNLIVATATLITLQNVLSLCSFDLGVTNTTVAGTYVYTSLDLLGSTINMTLSAEL
jgi:hypothetical protein